MPIDGATGTTFVIGEVPLAAHGARFKVVATNPSGSASSEGLLSVRADTEPPRLTNASSAGLTRVRVEFSERLNPASAGSTANFALSGGVRVLDAVPDPGGTLVVLATDAMTEGEAYTLTVNGVTDRSAAANPIAANSSFVFVALAYVPVDVGDPSVAGGIQQVPGGYDVTAGGSGVGAASDGFFFASQPETGDFDLELRVDGLGNSDVWAKAGLMARGSTNANSAFAAVLATPALAGIFFESRATDGAGSQRSGAFPSNPPESWLRLRRIGSRFFGYAGMDGRQWELLGSAEINLPSTLWVGLAVASHDSGERTLARFRDLGTSTGDVIRNHAVDREPPGPSSRRTGLVITEIMYAPPTRTDGRDVEFVEIMNSNPFPEEIGGYRLAGDVDFVFPAGTVIPGGAFLVVARNPADFRAVYGIESVMGPYSGALRRSGAVRLRNQLGAIYLEVFYSDLPPWPAAARGTGHSLVLARPSYGEASPRAWDISDRIGGSPGRIDGVRGDPLRSLVINEFLAGSEAPILDFIELYHHGAGALDISGCVLTDDADTPKFVIPSGTILSAGGFKSFTETELGFALSSSGETIYLKSPDGTRVLDAIRFGGQEAGVSSGRSPDGSDLIRPLSGRTPGAANGAPRVHDLVINEIMYKPISGDDDDQYVELHNQGSASRSLAGWRIEDGIEFTFPAGAVIPAGGYLVIARNRTNLLAKYPNLTPVNTVGNFTGRLAGKGERIALAQPLSSRETQEPVFAIVDEVTYVNGGRWGKWANGGGSSLELIDPRGDHRLASNWADSDETGKAAWTEVTATGVMDLGSSYSSGQTMTPINRLEVSLFGDGECLLDNVEVLSQTDVNRVANGTFESGISGWTPQGNHVRTTLETGEGFQSDTSLHLRASSRGDPSPNRVRTAISPALITGQTVTLRARARWVSGWPELLLRLKGNYFEAAGRLNVPSNLGTPGARNSRAVANAGPAIHSVQHHPVVPRASEAVVVTARLHDPDGIVEPTLEYRIDPSPQFNSVAFSDDGTSGDAVAGDGVWSAIIPGQNAGTLVAFHIRADDGAQPRVSAAFPSDAPVRECLVRFGDPDTAGSFGVYRQWFTAAAVSSWINRPVLSNERVEGTFVYGNFRAVYNFGSRYAGSPYHQSFPSPLANCHYSIEMPLDDLVLGTENFNKVHAPGNGPFDDDTHQREQTAYWLARKLDIPWNYRRFVVMYVNGNRRGQVMEDAQTPGSDLIDEYFPDDTEGDLFKLQPWFEFDDGNTGSTGFNNKSWCTLNNFVSGGQKKTARYRWNYLRRAAGTTANDYTEVFRLVDAANLLTPGDYVTNMESLVDADEWMRIFAVEHAVGNWDSFGYQNSQNMYAYKPRNGKWTLMIWDYNIVLGNSGSDGPNGNDLFNYSLSGQDQGAMNRFYTTPHFRRSYLRAFQDLAEGPMLASNVGPVMDAKYEAFLADGMSATSPAAVKTWIATMRQSLLAAVATQAGAPVFGIAGSGGEITTDQSSLTVSGTAPLRVKTIQVNGIEQVLRWTSISNWTMNVPLVPGLNHLAFRGYDGSGSLVGGAEGVLQARQTGVELAPVVINEFVSRNTQGIRNCDLRYEDWIELFNAGSVAVDLTGYSLTDSLASPGLWRFPQGTSIDPGGFLLVWADGGDDSCGDSELHAGFRLSADGEEIGFFTPDGKLIDAISYPWMDGNVSLGRALDGGAGDFVVFNQPSPRASNAAWRLGAGIEGGVMALRWTAIPGRTYRVESSSLEAPGAWAPLGPDLTAQGSEMTFRDPIASAIRFYRVVLLP
ncbi:MAG: lamin tail domain-containing protein [Limisphaerales bacterium]